MDTERSDEQPPWYRDAAFWVGVTFALFAGLVVVGLAALASVLMVACQ